MRVILLGLRGFPDVQGGVEKHCEQLAVYLTARGCEVIVFTRKPYVDPCVKEYRGVKLVALPAVRHKHLEALLHTFVGVLTAVYYRPDILHIQAIGPSFFAPLARMLGMKVVVTTHGPNYKHVKWGRAARSFLKCAERLGITFAHRVIAISNAIARDIEDQYGRRPEVIPNGVAVPQMLKSGNALRRYGLEKGKYVLSVGRFVPEKDYRTLISAFEKCNVSGLKLVIVGDADHEDTYSRELKQASHKNPDIIMPGFLTQEPLYELYSHAALFVLPSVYEGFPIALLEARSYGLACVASDITGNRNIDLEEECYFAPGDVDGLAEKITRFAACTCTDEGKRRQSRSVMEKYNWKQIADATREVYRGVLMNLQTD